MGTTLLIIYMHLASGKVAWKEFHYPTTDACQQAKRQVKSVVHQTWRFCK